MISPDEYGRDHEILDSGGAGTAPSTRAVFSNRLSLPFGFRPRSPASVQKFRNCWTATLDPAHPLMARCARPSARPFPCFHFLGRRCRVSASNEPKPYANDHVIAFNGKTATTAALLVPRLTRPSAFSHCERPVCEVGRPRPLVSIQREHRSSPLVTAASVKADLPCRRPRPHSHATQFSTQGAALKADTLAAFAPALPTRP